MLGRIPFILNSKHSFFNFLFSIAGQIEFSIESTWPHRIDSNFEISVCRQKRAGPLSGRRRLVPRQTDRRTRGAGSPWRQDVSGSPSRSEDGHSCRGRAQAEDTSPRGDRWTAPA